MLCDRLHAWWLAQSRLTTLIARRWVWPQTVGFLTFIWEQSSAQPGAKRREGCRICHYLSWTDSIKPSLLFSNFGCCISKGSFFYRLFNDGSGIKLSVKLAGAQWSVFGRAHRGSTVGLLLLQHFRVGLLLSTRLVSSQWWISIYMFAVLIHWWVEALHVDRTTSMCIWTTAEPRVRLLQRKTGLSPRTPPPVIYYWPFQCDASVVVYSNCQCSSVFCLSLTYCSIYLG